MPAILKTFSPLHPVSWVFPPTTILQLPFWSFINLPETVSDEWRALKRPLELTDFTYQQCFPWLYRGEARQGKVLPLSVTTHDFSQINLFLKQGMEKYDLYEKGSRKTSCNLLDPSFKPGYERKCSEMLSIIYFH